MNIELVKKAYEHFGGVWPTTGWKNIKKKNRLLAVCIENYSESGVSYKKGEIHQAGYGFDKDYWVAVCDKGEFCLYGAFIKPNEGKKPTPEEIEADCSVDDEWMPKAGVIKTLYWVAKVDSHGTPWNHDGPHESYNDALNSVPMLESINKSDRFIVTEQRFLPLKTERDEFIEHCMNGAIIPCNIGVMKIILGEAYDKGARIIKEGE